MESPNAGGDFFQGKRSEGIDEAAFLQFIYL